MSNSHRRLRAASFPLTVILGVVICGSLGTETASAEGAGKKINYVSRFAYGRCTMGMNEKDETVRSCAQLDPGPNLDQDLLWTGKVRITWYYADHTYAITSCAAPEGLAGDYFACADPR